MRKALIFVATAALALVAGTSPAAADGSGFCSISGSSVNINVKETPHEGSVKYISISSTFRLDTASPDHQSTRATIYYELNDNSVPIMPSHNAYEVVVPGDGLYNYRIDFNWDGEGLPFTQAGRARVDVEKANSQNDCYTNIYF